MDNDRSKDGQRIFSDEIITVLDDVHRFYGIGTLERFTELKGMIEARQRWRSMNDTGHILRATGVLRNGAESIGLFLSGRDAKR